MPYRSRMQAAALARLRKLFSTGAAKAIREAADLSLAEGAAHAEIDKTTLWKWEQLRRRPRGGSTAQRYLELLDELSR